MVYKSAEYLAAMHIKEITATLKSDEDKREYARLYIESINNAKSAIGRGELNTELIHQILLSMDDPGSATENHIQTISCPACKSTDLIKIGSTRTSKGRVQKYQCTICNRSFRGKEVLS